MEQSIEELEKKASSLRDERRVHQEAMWKEKEKVRELSDELRNVEFEIEEKKAVAKVRRRGGKTVTMVSQPAKVVLKPRG